MSAVPNLTLYVNNLNDKIHKEDLKKNLYNLFTTYGTIVDIIALKTKKCRGQAFIVFDNMPSATAALKALQNFNFLGKEMKIQFGKTKSNVIKQMEGTFKSAYIPLNTATPITSQTEKREREEEEDETEESANKKASNEETEEEANRILYIENLPAEATDEMVSFLFQQYAGFKEIRMVPGRPGLAFAEFETSAQATAAKTIMNGFHFSTENIIKVTYAKK
ncbi:RNA recognition protein [Neoconidiobolus thromboides FSU 785]|nr:RNA recognition protein [Neoconidiobolus thromboides FSU 785]